MREPPTTRADLRERYRVARPVAARVASRVEPVVPVLPIIVAQPFAEPALQKQQPSKVLNRPDVHTPITNVIADPIVYEQSQPQAVHLLEPRFAKLHALALTGAVLIFMIGIGVVVGTTIVHHGSQSQAAIISNN